MREVEQKCENNWEIFWGAFTFLYGDEVQRMFKTMEWPKCNGIWCIFLGGKDLYKMQFYLLFIDILYRSNKVKFCTANPVI